MANISSNDTQSLNNLHRNNLEAWNSGDLDGFMDGFTDDVVWMPSGQAPVVGNEACRQSTLKWFPQLFSGNPENVQDIVIDYEESVVSGDWGYERISIPLWNMKGIHILQKQADGLWKIARYIWNDNSTE